MARLVGSFLTVSVLTVVFVALVAFFEARHALREAIADRLETVALQKEGELNRWVDLQRRLTVFLSSRPQRRGDSALLAGEESHEARARIEALLLAAIGSRPDFEALCLLSPIGGEVLVSSLLKELTESAVGVAFGEGREVDGGV